MDGGTTNTGASETMLRSDLPDAVMDEEEPTEGGPPDDTVHGAAATNVMHQIPTTPAGWAAAIHDFDEFRTYHP
eukprot:3003005-Heterocapsa_arctica.AAC.1